MVFYLVCSLVLGGNFVVYAVAWITASLFHTFLALQVIIFRSSSSSIPFLSQQNHFRCFLFDKLCVHVNVYPSEVCILSFTVLCNPFNIRYVYCYICTSLSIEAFCFVYINRWCVEFYYYRESLYLTKCVIATR